VGRHLPVASLGGDIRRYVGDRNPVEHGPEATPGTGNRPRQGNLDCNGTLLPATDSSGCPRGLFRLHPNQGNYCFWVWIAPTAYLATKIIWWTPTNVLGSHNWGAALADLFVGTPPHYPEGNVTIPFYTSLSYTFGALLDAGNVFRVQHPSNGGSC
jgi:hypothetical protein